MKHVKRFLALSLAAALLAGCVSCGNSDEKFRCGQYRRRRHSADCDDLRGPA